jgi:SAM-dependent methyltransferase
MPNVTIEDFAESFGTSIDDIRNGCSQLIGESNFNYRTVEGEERDRVILDILRRIELDQQVIASPERKEVWQTGWQENYENFIQSNYSLEKLIPRFIRPNRPMRFRRNYVLSENPMFELDYFRVFRRWLFTKYFKDVGSIYEFGSGTGFNLVELAQLYPQKTLYGLDFVPAAVDLVNKIGEVYGWPIRGNLFDMMSPDHNFRICQNSAVFTFGAIEQLGGNFEPFLQYILGQSPEVCINLEPTIELYDENNLVDYLAIRFHKKRGYTENYLSRLKQLEAEARISILKIKRLFFGNEYMEGFSYTVWKPNRRI